MQTSTDSWSGVTSAGASAECQAEQAEAADGSPTLDQPKIPVPFGDAFVPYSFQIGTDAANFRPPLQPVLLDQADQLMGRT